MMLIKAIKESSDRWLCLLMCLAIQKMCGDILAAEPLISKEPAAVLEGAKGRIFAMAVSPDGGLLASAGYDIPEDDSRQYVIRVWSLAENKQVRQIAVDCDSINAIAFDPAGSRVAVGDRNGLVSCWNAMTGEHVFTTAPSGAETKGIIFARKGSLVLSGSDALRGWESRSGKLLGEVKTPNEWAVSCMALSRDESAIVAGFGGDGAVLDAITLRPIRMFPGHEQGVTAVAITGDKTRAAIGAGSGAIKIWNARSGKELVTLQGHAGGVNCLAYIDRDRRLVSGGNDGKLRVWEVSSGKEEQAIDASSLAVDALAGSPDGKWLINNDIIRIQVRRIGTGDGGRAPNAKAPMPKPRKAPDLNKLENWEVVRGDWKQANGGIVGGGNSRINFRGTFPNDLTLKFKLRVNGPTNPRVRFGSFHFGYEGSDRQFFLHGPKADGERFTFEFGQEYAVEVRIVGDQATLLIDGKKIATSNPKVLDERQISLEAGGVRSRSSAEFYAMEIYTEP